MEPSPTPTGAGRHFEDFTVGDVYRHALGRTISEADNTWFTLLTLNSNQMHFNAAYAASSTYGRLLVNSGFTLALTLGMSVADLSQHAVANLGFDEVRFTHPVFVGDTLWAESIVLETRPSASRPYAGVVTARTRALNQDGDECVTYRRSVMIYRRDAPHHKDVFPRAVTPLALDAPER